MVDKFLSRPVAYYAYLLDFFDSFLLPSSVSMVVANWAHFQNIFSVSTLAKP
jgi:hypothetical protein